MSKEITIKTKGPFQLSEIIIAKSPLGKGIQEFDNSFYVSPESLTKQVEEMVEITEETLEDKERGIMNFINLINPETHETVKRKIGWIFMNPNPGWEMIKDKFGFPNKTTQDIQVLLEEV